MSDDGDCRYPVGGHTKPDPATSQLTREQVATINSMAHQIVLKWSQIVIGLNRHNGLSLKHDIETLVKDVAEQALTRQALTRQALTRQALTRQALTREQVAEQLCKKTSEWSVVAATWPNLSQSAKEFYLVMADWVLAEQEAQRQAIERLVRQADSNYELYELTRNENANLKAQLLAMTAERNAAQFMAKRGVETLEKQIQRTNDVSKQLAASQVRAKQLEDERAMYVGDVYSGPFYQNKCKELQATLAAREADLEQTRVQLAGCLTAAEGHNNETAKHGDYGWSLAYQQTLNLRITYDATVQEVGRLREALQLALARPWVGIESVVELERKRAQAALAALTP